MPIFSTDPINTAPPTAGTSANTSVASIATSTTLLAANAARLGGSIFNDSTKELSILLGAGPITLANRSKKLAAGQEYEIESEYTGIIVGAWFNGLNGAAHVTELTP